VPRKVFVAGEILTAADVNTNLMDQTVMVFDDAAARTAAIPSPTEGMVTYLKSDDSVTKFNGAAFVPVGGILQVVQTVKTDTFSVGASSYTTVTGLTATITPSSTSSKILILAQLSIGLSNSPQGSPIFRLAGGNATTYVGDADGSRTRGVAGYRSGNNGYENDSTTLGVMSFLDSPNTTSATTYSVEVFNTEGTGYINRPGNNTDTTTRARSASSITLMEVAG